MVDARGATTNYAYTDARGLLTGISYQKPTGSTTVPDTPSVSFEYDNTGNRKKMTDGLGTIDYAYTEFSQLKTETRIFNQTHAPSGTNAINNFPLTYEYTLSGQLKFIKDPYNDQIDYAHDRAGRLTAVTGSAFGGRTSYAHTPQYRAWGGLESLTYGNGTKMTLTFNNRLQADTFKLTDTNLQTVMDKSYEYYADGKLRKLDDKTLYGAYDLFDRMIKYDQMGRPKEGKSSAEARGTTITDAEQQKQQLPYRQSYSFNGFGNMTTRNNRHWGIETWYNQNNNLSYSYENNKITNTGWQYDADGRATDAVESNSYISSIYDAKGQLVKITSDNERETNRFYDGGGREGKRTSKNYVENGQGGGSWVDEPKKYYIRSSVLGGEVVSETDASGRKAKTYVRAAGATLAWQTVYYHPTTQAESEYVNFEHFDASGLSYRSTANDGTTIYGEGAEGSPAELDPMGSNVGLYTPYIELIQPIEPEYPSLQPLNMDMPVYVDGQRVTATLDGMEIPIGMVLGMMQNGSAIPAALAPYQHLPGFQFNSNGLGIFTVQILRQVGWHVNPDQSVSRVYSRNTFDTFVVSYGSWNISPNPQSPTPGTNSTPDTERVPSPASDCDSHEKFLLRSDVLEAVCKLKTKVDLTISLSV